MIECYECKDLALSAADGGHQDVRRVIVYRKRAGVWYDKPTEHRGNLCGMHREDLKKQGIIVNVLKEPAE